MPKDKQWRKIIKKLVEERDKRCSKCGQECTIYRKDGRYFRRCYWKFCKFEEGIFKGTIFEESRISYSKVLKIMRYWFSKVPHVSISELLSTNKNTISDYLKKPEQIIDEKYYDSLGVIGGPNVIVEIDESKFGKRKYHRGHRVDGCWVLGMVERTIERRIVVVIVENRKEETLVVVLKRYIHPDSIIYSDCWAAYNKLDEHFAAHGTVNHSVSFVDFVSGVHSNTIEGNWAGLKQGVPVQCKTKNRLMLYLLRYMFKRNSTSDPFLDFIKFLFKYYLFVI